MKLTKETKIGIIAVITFALLIWGFNFLKGKNIIVTSNYYYAVYDHIDGLEGASPVMLSGFKIGVVETIKFHKQQRDKLVVRFSVDKDIKLPVNTIAVIEPATIIAGKIINLKFSESTHFHSKGDTLIGEVKPGLESQLIPIKDKAEQLISSLDSVLSIFDAERRQGLKNSLDNIENITGDLSGLVAEEKQKLAKILTNFESISNNLKNNNEKISTVLANFSSISDSLAQANIKTTVLNANKTLAELGDIAGKINNGEGTVGLLINNDSLYVNLNQLAADLDKLVIDLNENPKRYVHFSLFGKKDK
ncbi:MAG: MlaD family protein [Bacteroidales bacterium]|jgi:phospholipid/cholesterol/gamma-HCH transport system substrate-binding protein|nr:MlaD family protein [Bacteroidales bacterium]